MEARGWLETEEAGGRDGSDGGCGRTGGSDHLRCSAAGAFARFP